MESIVSAFSDQSIQRHYSTALTKIRSVLHSSQKDSVERLADNIKLQVPVCFVQNFDYLTRIQKAITSQKILEIGYTNKQEEVSVRKMEPIGLIFYALSWHLIGWCHNKKDYRDFRVSRILRLNCTEENFTIPKHMPLEDYMKLLPVKY
jgi:predicted DNA-binding transcriptional regulator YafY